MTPTVAGGPARSRPAAPSVNVRRRRARAAGLVAAALMAATVLAATPASGDEAPARLLVRVTTGASLPAGAVRVQSADGDPLAHIGWTTVEVAAGRSDEVSHRLLASGTASAVEEAQPVHALTTTPNDPGYFAQWEHVNTSTNRAWDTTTGSPTVTIAIIDTGVNPSTDLGNRLLAGWNVLTATADTTDDHLGLPGQPGHHGTAAAHVAAATGDNSVGGAGVCWTCKILPVKVLDAGGAGTTSQSAAGLVWAVDHGATIASLSLGGVTSTQIEQDAVNYALGHGVPVVAAAGNSGTAVPNYPAAFPGVIGVGASQATDLRYAFSNFGDWVTVTAPGCDVVSPTPPTLESFCGTSAATPYVAGAVALRRATGRFPGETPATTRAAVMSSAHRTGEVGVSASGRLRTDALIGGWSELPPTGPGLPASVTNARYTPVPPTRVLDTRFGNGAPIQRVGPHQSLYLQVAGAGGVPVTGASAAVLNVTVTNATAPSYLSVFPDGAPGPSASSINFTAGRTVPNLVTSRLGADGYVVIYNDSGFVDIVADVQGYYDSGDGAGTSGYTPLTPSRMLDTRDANGPPLGTGASLNLQATDTGGVPASGVTAVALNVTVAGATAGSYLTVWPRGLAKPVASNLNFGAGDIVPNMVVVPVGTGGQISIFNALGTTHVIVDVVGWFGAAATAAFTPLTPTRALDTRAVPAAPIGASGTRNVQIAGFWGVPTGAAGVVLNVTVTDPTAGSFVALWPADAPNRPTVSNLNFGQGVTIANMAVVKLSTDGRLSIYNASGTAHVIVDVVGYLS
jgi:hypothetical protein